MIVVVGGAVMDLKMQTIRAATLRTSNPARASWTPGGVGRNIAENLARLGSPVQLVAAVGTDPQGHALLERTSNAGVGVGHVIRTTAPTGLYCAVVDNSGELVLGVSDLHSTDDLTVEDLAAHRSLVHAATLLVVDGNLPATVVAHLLDLAASAAVPVVIDPVSVRKATLLRDALGSARPVHTLTPNLDELAALVDHPVTDEPAALAAAADALHAQGVVHVWVRRGSHGSVLFARGSSPVAYAAPPATVVDVTGAGDSMTAGYVHALGATGDVAYAAGYGQALASLTVESLSTVRPDLTPALVETRLAAELPRKPITDERHP